MLSERIEYKYGREWRHFLALRRVLHTKRLSTEWTGPTSVSDNIFTGIEDALNVYGLVQDHHDLIERAVQREVRLRHEPYVPDQDEIELMHRNESIITNLQRLAQALERYSTFFADAARTTGRLI